MKYNYFIPVQSGYYILTHEHNKQVTVFKNNKPVTAFADLPRELIRQVADYKGLYLYGEMSYYTGRNVHKVGRLRDESTGVIQLHSTEARASFNRFIVETLLQGDNSTVYRSGGIAWSNSKTQHKRGLNATDNTNNTRQRRASIG